MDDFTCQYIECKGCNVSFRWQSQLFNLQENGQWENIVMWDKGCCICHTVTFVIRQDQEVMEGMKHDEVIATKYKELKRCTIIRNQERLKKF
jgi:hypothetical protein